jgi:RNA polymerase sigma factor (sigma-70 family)
MALSVNISSLENRRIAYPLAQTQEFLSMEEYLKIAKKTITYYCKKNKELTHNLLTSEDAISFIAEQLMMGDWRYKPVYEKKVFDGEGNLLRIDTLNISRWSYRNKCAVWAIKNYIEKSNNKKNLQLQSLDIQKDSETVNLYDLVEDDKSLPVYKIFDETVKKKIHYLLNNSKLSDPQKQCVTMYFLEDLTLEEVGVKLGITKQGVQQNVERALNNMRLTAGLVEK